MATTATTTCLASIRWRRSRASTRKSDDFLKRLKAIPTDGMADKDLLSHRLLERQIERDDINYDLKNYEMPVNQQRGIHTQLADLPLSRAFRFRAALPGLHFPAAPDPARAGSDGRGMRQGLKDGLDAAQARAREASRPMRRHHFRESIPHPDKEISGGVFGRRTRSD